MDDLQYGDLWEALSTVARSFAYTCYAGTSLRLAVDPEDFAQEATLACWEFARKRADAHGDLFVLDEAFVLEIYAWLHACLKNRFVGECRKARRRQRLMPVDDRDIGDFSELAGDGGHGWVNFEQYLIHQAMLDAMEQQARTAGERRIIATLRNIDVEFNSDETITPTAFNRAARVSAKQTRRLAARVARAQIVSPRENAGQRWDQKRSGNPTTAKSATEKDHDDETA